MPLTQINSTVLNTLSGVNVTGNVLASSIITNFLTADDVVFGNVSAAVFGNTGATYTGATINLSGNVLAGLARFAAINNTPIGNATASAGTFTTVTAGQISSGFVGNTGTAFTGASINLSGNVSANSHIGDSVNVSGNVSANTISAWALGGTITTASQTNITSVGTLGSLTVTGNVTVSGNVKLSAAGWSVRETGTKLYFAYNGINKMSLDTGGNLVVTGDVTGFGTIT